MLRSPLLLHIPHAATCIPLSEYGDFVVDRATLDAQRATLDAELLRLTDRYTDALYGDGFPPPQIVAADVSRLVVDVERFSDDSFEPCAAQGMGAVYVRTSTGAPLRRISDQRRAELLAKYDWPHHRRLDAMALLALEQFGRCVIIDAHSFPVQPLPTQVALTDLPEIGIGTDMTHTSAALRALTEAFFVDRGFHVGVECLLRSGCAGTVGDDRGASRSLHGRAHGRTAAGVSRRAAGAHRVSHDARGVVAGSWAILLGLSC